MSKRVSSARRLARDSRTHLERARLNARFAPEYLDTLERLTERFEAIAAHVDEVWSHLSMAARTDAPSLIDESRSVTVLHSGENETLLARVREIWRAGHVTDYFAIQEEYAAAAAAAGDRVPWW